MSDDDIVDKSIENAHTMQYTRMVLRYAVALVALTYAAMAQCDGQQTVWHGNGYREGKAWCDRPTSEPR